MANFSSRNLKSPIIDDFWGLKSPAIRFFCYWEAIEFDASQNLKNGFFLEDIIGYKYMDIYPIFVA